MCVRGVDPLVVLLLGPHAVEVKLAVELESIFVVDLNMPGQQEIETLSQLFHTNIYIYTPTDI